MKIHDSIAQEHGLPKGSTILRHTITVEGLYLAIDKHGDKLKREYREEFELPPGAHLLHAQGALGHVLAGALAARLREKHPDFRSIHTHHIAEHYNKFEAPRAPAPQDESDEA